MNINISKSVSLLAVTASAAVGSGVALIVSTVGKDNGSGHHIQLYASLVMLACFIIATGVFAYYHVSLRVALHNQDEAQKLAKLGSWERSLINGGAYWSKNMYRLLGLEAAKKPPSMENFYLMLHPEDRQLFRRAVELAESSGKGFEMVYRLAADPANRYFANHCTVVFGDNGRPSTLAGTTRDITEKMKEQHAAETVIRQKDMFISRLGHDLNTPLTPLITLLPLVRASITDEKQGRRVDLCIQAASHIRNLVASSMQLARRFQPLRRPLSLEPAFLKDIVDEAMAEMKDFFRESSVICKNSITSELIAIADRSEIKLLFTHLFTNSVKFSPAGSVINCAASLEGVAVKIFVRDMGIGLSSEELPHIFDEFYKADSSRHDLDAAGLGLSICRQVVINHGGDIWAESEGKGFGTTIFFTLKAGGAI